MNYNETDTLLLIKKQQLQFTFLWWLTMAKHSLTVCDRDWSRLTCIIIYSCCRFTYVYWWYSDNRVQLWPWINTALSIFTLREYLRASGTTAPVDMHYFVCIYFCVPYITHFHSCIHSSWVFRHRVQVKQARPLSWQWLWNSSSV